MLTETVVPQLKKWKFYLILCQAIALLLILDLWSLPVHAEVLMQINHDYPRQELPKTILIKPQRIVSMAIEDEKFEEWNYQGISAPRYWSELREDYSLCSQGQEQSPINLSLTDYNLAGIIEFKPNPTNVTVINNGHTIQINYSQAQIARINDRNYELQQVHFHTPSEHTMNGKNYAMEIHLVYREARGKLAVLSTMVEPGMPNQNIVKIWQNLPTIKQSWQSDFMLSPQIFLPQDNQSYAQYSGSLTTPPCTEGVTWIIFQQPITFSPEQIQTFQALYPANARPIQRNSQQ